VLGAIDAGLELIPKLDKERSGLIEKSDFLRGSLQEMGFDTGKSTTQIIPVIIGSDEKVLKLAKWLADNNFLIVAIRPPTVEKGKSRLRLTVSAGHTMQQIKDLLKLFKQWKSK